jgi:hypothetical protein
MNIVAQNNSLSTGVCTPASFILQNEDSATPLWLRGEGDYFSGISGVPDADSTIFAA